MSYLVLKAPCEKNSCVALEKSSRHKDVSVVFSLILRRETKIKISALIRLLNGEKDENATFRYTITFYPFRKKAIKYTNGHTTIRTHVTTTVFFIKF